MADTMGKTVMMSSPRALLAASTLLASLGSAICAGALPAFTFDEPERILINIADAAKVEAPMRLVDDSNVAKGKYLWAPEGPGHKELHKQGQGSATYEFEVKTRGKYAFWGRGHWCCGCGNSLFIQFDDRGQQYLFADDGTYGVWHWVRYGGTGDKTFRFREGKHTLKITNREDGAKIDQVLLLLEDSQDKEEQYVPVGIEE